MTEVTDYLTTVRNDVSYLINSMQTPFFTTKEHSKEVTLTKGEYVYFCPLNPTPQYTLVVK